MTWQVTCQSPHTDSDGTGVAQVQWVDSVTGRTVLVDLSLGPDDGDELQVVSQGVAIGGAWSNV